VNRDDMNLDLLAALECNGHGAFVERIVDILATIEGENDERNWHWIVRTDEGFAYVTGGCDNTGWDCQSNCDVFEASTIRDCLRLVGDAERGELRDQLPEALRSQL